MPANPKRAARLLSLRLLGTSLGLLLLVPVFVLLASHANASEGAEASNTALAQLSTGVHAHAHETDATADTGDHQGHPDPLHCGAGHAACTFIVSSAPGMVPTGSRSAIQTPRKSAGAGRIAPPDTHPPQSCL